MTQLFALALLLTTTATAATASTDSAATTAATEAQKAKPKKICKLDPRVTGTRIAKRICKTEEEWAAKEDGQDLQVKGAAGDPQPICFTCRPDPGRIGTPTP